MLRQAVVLAGLTAALIVGAVGSAFADGGAGNQGGWGSVECDQNPSPGCNLGAGSSGTQLGTGGGTQSPGGSTGSGGGTSDPNTNPVQCAYVRSDFQPPPDSGSTVVAAAFSEQPLNVVTVDTSAAPPQPGGAWLCMSAPELVSGMRSIERRCGSLTRTRRDRQRRRRLRWPRKLAASSACRGRRFS